ncbi:Cerato-platanin [Pluteus cervinus]|uniref:Cerato-platanin n=1 Tax=Pluteus cervinus TaxID=181527 RepID=A0ACD3AWD5_9AGAR|nr:Cerato-platanin [Pluteus cervinus]
MKFSAVYTLAALVSLALADDTVSYDTVYDNPNGALTSVSCSDGTNGLITKGYDIFKDLPSFPYIGGVPAVAGWNSPACGSCWELVYPPGDDPEQTIYVLAIDHALTYNIALTAMNNLTNGNAIAWGTAPITATEVAGSFCGL